jgi:hypothetical protein
VYTWVDGHDPVWLASRQPHQPQDATADATDLSRFESVDELLYSLRGLLRYFVGVGRIFVVTDNQTPDFLDEFDGRVEIVSHDQIFSSETARPTFNSHAIETSLHHIKGLSEHYLYLNDDFLFAAPVCPADFFNEQGLPKFFYSSRAMIPTVEKEEDLVAVDCAARNAQAIFKARYGHSITHKFQHVPVASSRKVLAEIEEKFMDEIVVTRGNRFRSKTDISVATSFYPHYVIRKNLGILSSIQYRYYDTRSPSLPLKLFKLCIEPVELRPLVFCLNAVGNSDLSARNAKTITEQMDMLLPPARLPEVSVNTVLDRIKRRVFYALLKGLKVGLRIRRQMMLQA